MSSHLSQTPSTAPISYLTSSPKNQVPEPACRAMAIFGTPLQFEAACMTFSRPLIHPLVTNHHLCASDPLAAPDVSTALYKSVLPGTLARYDSATRSYLAWCLVRGLQPWPTDAILIMGWLRRQVCTSMVKTLRYYISAVRKTQINLGHPWTLMGDPAIFSCMR